MYTMPEFSLQKERKKTGTITDQNILCEKMSFHTSFEGRQGEKDYDGERKGENSRFVQQRNGRPNNLNRRTEKELKVRRIQKGTAKRFTSFNQMTFI